MQSNGRSNLSSLTLRASGSQLRNARSPDASLMPESDLTSIHVTG